MTVSFIPVRPVEVQGFDGVASSPHVLSTQAAMAILDEGGNAVDAAIAANAVQGTVAPETCGIGGDLFALVSGPGIETPLALNSSGRAGGGADAAGMRQAGLDSIPQRHPAAVTVPGCVDGWLALSERLGTMSLQRLLRPAIRLADNGFPLNQEMAAGFSHRSDELKTEPAADPFYSSGLLPGARVRRPALAETLRRLGAEGRSSFYEGAIARAISAAVDEHLTLDDLARSHAEWVVPLSVEVFGRTVWTVPPNSSGYAAVAALGILERLGLPAPDDPLAWHRSIESYRSAAADLSRVLADPAAMEIGSDRLVDPATLDRLADRVNDDSVATTRPSTPSGAGGTAYMCVVDGNGMGVSLIQSNFYGIGSGISVGAYGFMLHDRGRGFTLESGHPNELAPGKRPLHTLSPTIWTRRGELDMVLGTRGGYSQPQLVLQLAAGITGQSFSPALAQARPRWETEVPGGEAQIDVRVEPGTPDAVVAGLRQRGHEVSRVEVPASGWGPMSVITVDEDGLRTGAADPRVATAAAAAR